MNPIPARLRWLLLPALVMALLAGTTGAASAAKLSGTLNGSGSTFQAAFDQVVIQALTQKNSGLTINYNPTGSGAGQTDLQGQITNFAGSDVPVKAADVSKFKGGKVLTFPTVAAPITVSYHLSGVKGLQLSPDTVAKIFSRQIKTWDDPAIKQDNPKAKLPSTAITVAHRSEASGTTAQFTGYLTKVAPTVWTGGTGTTVNWASDTQGAEKNTGVAQVIKSTDGAVGYVDFSDAKASGLVFAKVKNKAGKFVAPSLNATSAALAGTAVNPDLTLDPTDAAGSSTYPIVSPTYVLVYQSQTNKQTADNIKGFLTFAYNDGQKLAPQVNFAPLPKSLKDKALSQVKQIQSA